MLKKFVYIIFFINYIFCLKIDGSLNICRIHYDGGGDWYSDQSSLPNLIEFITENTNMLINEEEKIVKIGDNDFLKNSYFYLTGHGNINFNNEEIITLREHLLNGAFLHADDNYGMDASFRKMVKKIFPEKELVELPSNHPIFSCFYKFEDGLPKIHEHDNNRPQAYGIFNDNEKLILLYTYESDLGDGWENANVHNNPENLRLEALKMGTNIVLYSIIQ